MRRHARMLIRQAVERQHLPSLRRILGDDNAHLPACGAPWRLKVTLCLVDEERRQAALEWALRVGAPALRTGERHRRTGGGGGARGVDDDGDAVTQVTQVLGGSVLLFDAPDEEEGAATEGAGGAATATATATATTTRAYVDGGRVTTAPCLDFR